MSASPDTFDARAYLDDLHHFGEGPDLLELQFQFIHDEINKGRPNMLFKIKIMHFSEVY